jgi:DNA invertase Pin-like site-specific DNA recombinase
LIIIQVNGKETKALPSIRDAKAEPEGICTLTKKELVRMLRAKGYKPKEIAEKTGIPLSTVHGFTRKKKKTGGKPKKERNDEIIRRARRERPADLVREFEITRSRVYAICKRG